MPRLSKLARPALLLLLVHGGAALAQDAMTSPTPLPSATTAMPTEEKAVEDKMMKMDTDKNGTISRKEADVTMRTHWKDWDLNEDGRIDPEEFSSAAKAAPRETKTSAGAR